MSIRVVGRENNTFMKKNPDSELEPTEAPSTSELEALGVLWQEQLGTNHPLPLSEVHHRICEKRGKGDFPALSTVSSQLRSLLVKKWIEETTLAGSSPIATRGPIRTRGASSVPQRSPFTSYRVRHSPKTAMSSIFAELISVYPDGFDILVDVASALEGFSAKGLEELQKLVQTEKERRGKNPK